MAIGTALLKTFAAFFDELGGILGAIGGKRGGHKARYGTRLVVGNQGRRTTGPLVTPCRSPWKARPGRVSEDVGLEGWSVGVSGAAWACSRESAAPLPPTHPNALLRPHNTLPGGVIGKGTATTPPPDTP